MNTDIIYLIKNKINYLLNSKFDLENISQIDFPDHIEKILCNKIIELKYNNLIVNDISISKPIEDIEINYSGYTYKIDIKINDINKDLNSINLMSIDKIKKILVDNKNYIIYIFLDYFIKNNKSIIKNIRIFPIESLNWEYLYIQNIGKGQLQLKNIFNKSIFNNNINRKDWINNLIKEGEDYYDKLILKVSEYKNNWIEDKNK